jgi:hypothetical protein
VLLTGPGGAAWRAAAPAGIDVHRIDEPGWAEVYGTRPDGAVLVRPDGHVAWRCAGPPETATTGLAEAVGAVLGQSVVPA